MFYMKLCYALLLVPTHAYVNMEGNRLKHRGLFEIMFRWIMTEPFVYFDIYVKKGYFDNRKFIKILTTINHLGTAAVFGWHSVAKLITSYSLFGRRFSIADWLFFFFVKIKTEVQEKQTKWWLWDPAARMKRKILLVNVKLKAMYTV